MGRIALALLEEAILGYIYTDANEPVAAPTLDIAAGRPVNVALVVDELTRDVVRSVLRILEAEGKLVRTGRFWSLAPDEHARRATWRR